MNSKTVLRAAIFGCGRMGNIRATHLQSLGCSVDFVHDPDIARARALAALLPKCLVIKHPELTPWHALDLAVIATPPGARMELFVMASGAGLSIFVEKPVGLDAVTWARLSVADNLNSRIVGVGYMNRCRPSVALVKQVLTHNKPFASQARWVGGRYNVPWWTDDNLSGGPLNEQAGHLVDLLRHLVGEIGTTQCRVEVSNSQYKGAVATFRFQSGSIGTLLHSCESNTKDIGIDFFCPDGTTRLSGWQFDAEVSDGRSLSGMIGGDRDGIFLEEMRQYLVAVRAQDPALVPCSLESAIRTQAVLDAMRDSARREVECDVVLPPGFERLSMGMPLATE